MLIPLLLAASLAACVPRPAILGISHVAFRVSDLKTARAFYQDFLGYPVSPADETTLLVRINAHQHVELIAGLRSGEDRLDHVALRTDDVAGLRQSLAAQGLDVPERAGRDVAGALGFTIRDPEGHLLEFVQHPHEGWPSPAAAGGISGRLRHAGIIVGDLAAAALFYQKRFTFSETWRGSRSGTELSWTNMKVYDGDDYLEFMLYGTRPAPDARGSAHHICLEVDDVEAARARLAARPYMATYTRPLESRVGTNRRRQLNLYDPDGTRVELMEPVTVDGQPVPSSTAPPPSGASVPRPPS
jgi:catechol 2,3-dioxygenase-like lactoylglutathione lyase family enzyme